MTNKKTCSNCKYYVENRLPKYIKKHGRHSGYCWYKDKLLKIAGETIPINHGQGYFQGLVVMADNVCEKWESL